MATREEDAQQTRDFEHESTHCRNYRHLTYYLALSSFELALQLAASAVLPLTRDSDDDDRLSNLIFSFDDWSNLIFCYKMFVLD
jgi:hypothetical protein